MSREGMEEVGGGGQHVCFTDSVSACLQKLGGWLGRVRSQVCRAGLPWGWAGAPDLPRVFISRKLE